MVCKIMGATLLTICAIASIFWFRWALREIGRLSKRVEYLEGKLDDVCKNWSADAEDSSEEMLQMVADHEQEKARYETTIKNLKHANKQLAKGEKSND